MITITVKGNKSGVLYQNLSIETATECIIAARIMAKVFAAATGNPEQLSMLFITKKAIDLMTKERRKGD